MGEAEHLDFHDFWIFGTRLSPYLWIWIYHITFRKSKEKYPNHLTNLIFIDFNILEIDVVKGGGGSKHGD